MKDAMVTAAVLLLFYTLGVFAHYGYVAKPGDCPSQLANRRGSWKWGCRSDSRCPGSQKCCGRRCLDAVFTPCTGNAGSNCNVNQIISYVRQRSAMIGMQAAAFKVGEYNEQVAANFPGETGEKMQLPYANNTLAFTITYSSEQYAKFDDAVAAFAPQFSAIEQHFSCHQIRYIGGNDFNSTIMLPTVHVQTAGHASGNTFYYQKPQVVDPPSTWDGKNIFGISINNEFRLGTVFTAVLVFEDVQSDSFQPQPPVDVYFTQAEKIMLLSWVNGLAKPPIVPDEHVVDEAA